MADALSTPVISPEAEVASLDNILFRLASVTAEDTLSTILSKLLPPLLAKLRADVAPTVKAKLLEIFSHVNKRVRDRPAFQLPVLALVEQLKTADTASIPFILIYIRMGFPRLSTAEHGALFPILWNVLSFPASARDTVLVLGLKALRQTTLPHELAERLKNGDPTLHEYSWLLDSDGRALILEFITDVLLFSLTGTIKEVDGGTELHIQDAMDIRRYARLLGAADTSPKAMGKAAKLFDSKEELAWKQDVLRLVSASVFSEAESLSLAIIASCSTFQSVADVGEDLFKRHNLNANVEDSQTLSYLFRLCSTPYGKGDASSLLLPTSHLVRVKAFGLLLRSRAAVADVTRAIGVVSANLFTAGVPPKLKVLAAKLLLNVVQFSTGSTVTSLAPIFLKMFMSLLEGDAAGDITSAEQTLISQQAYAGIAQLCTRSPAIVSRDIKVPELLFGRLTKAITDQRLTIIESLSQVATAFQWTYTPEYFTQRTAATAPNGRQWALLPLLQANADAADDRIRLAVVEWAVRCFPFDFVPARMLCVQALSDSSGEVRTAAVQGLRVAAQVNRVASALSEVADKTALQNMLLPSFQELLKGYVDFKAAAMPSICTAASLELCANAFRAELTTRNGDAEFIAQAQQLCQYLDAALKVDPAKVGASQLVEIAATTLADVLSRLPTLRYDPEAAWLLSFLGNPNKLVRRAVSELVSRVCVHNISANPSTWPSLVNPVVDALIGWVNSDDIRVISLQLGSSTALSYVFCALADAVCGETFVETQRAMQHKICTTLLRLFPRKQKAVKAHAIDSIARISRKSTLPIPLGDVKDLPGFLQAMRKNSEIAAEVFVDSKIHVVATLYRFACGAGAEAASTASDETTVDESSAALTGVCASCLGALATGEINAMISSSSEAQNIPPVSLLSIQALLALSMNRSEQVQFNVANALAEVCSGQVPNVVLEKPSVLESDQISMEVFSSPSESKRASCGTPQTAIVRNKALDMALDSILTGPTVSLTPHQRTSAAIWLLTIIHSTRTERLPALESRFNLLQVAFLQLLADKSEFTQDCAAKGLALVYESSGSDTKKGLLDNLLDTFDSGHRSAGAVSSTGPSGISLSAAGDSAYKELCAMANEVGQPDLVYKFLALASHQSHWHNKGAASVGLEALLQTFATEDLRPVLKVLIPKLFRYQYDPSTRIKQSMTRLWTAIVKDPARSVTEHIHSILPELITSSSAEAWREREGACLALNDALHGRIAADVLPHLAQLWRATMRAIDDVKDTVREAALMVQQTLSKLTLRLCDPLQTSTAESRGVVTIMLPFLLKDGISSPIKDAQSACWLMLRDICKNAGKLLIPHIPELVFTVLSAMSALENSSLSTLQIHADAGTGQYGADLDPQKLEFLRISATKNGPLAEVLDACATQLREMPLVELDPGAAEDDDDAPEKGKKKGPDTLLSLLVGRLRDIIVSGIGLPTRGACARFICGLCIARSEALKPHALQLIRALQGALSDPSMTLKKEFATAAAYLCRNCKSGTLKKYIARLVELAKSADDADSRRIAGFGVRELFRLAFDKAKPALSDVVPVLLMGCHDPDTAVASAWREASESVSESLPRTVRMFADEIIAAILETLDSSSWVLKRQSCKALSTVVADMVARSDFSDSAGAAEHGIAIPILNPPELQKVQLTGDDATVARSVLRVCTQHCRKLHFPQAPELFPHAAAMLEKIVGSLAGRLWEGKEDIVTAAADVSCCTASHVPHMKPQVLTALVQQLGKSSAKIEYTTAVGRAIARVMATVGTGAEETDMLGSFKSVLQRANRVPADTAGPTSSTSTSGATVMGGVTNESKESEARLEAKDLAQRECQLAIFAYLCLALSLPDFVQDSTGDDTLSSTTDVRLAIQTSLPGRQEPSTQLMAEFCKIAKVIGAAHIDQVALPVLGVLLAAWSRTQDWSERAAACHAFAIVLAKVDFAFLQRSENSPVVRSIIQIIQGWMQAEERYPAVRIGALRVAVMLVQRFPQALAADGKLSGFIDECAKLRSSSDGRISSLAAQVYEGKTKS